MGRSQVDLLGTRCMAMTLLVNSTAILKRRAASSIRTASVWIRHAWTETSEKFVDEEDRARAERFGVGYAFAQQVFLAIFGLVFGPILFILALAMLLAVGQLIRKELLQHQLGWFGTDSPLVVPLVLGAYGLLVLLWVIPWLQVAGSSKVSTEQKFLMENESRKTLAQIAGGAILLAGIYTSFRTLDVSRQGQLEERFSRAVEQIGASENSGRPRIEVRLGGIFTLGRIAEQSKPLEVHVKEVLEGYVVANEAPKGVLRKARPVRQDVQAALAILGIPDGSTHYVARLRGLDLRGMDFSSHDYSYSHFEGSDFRGCDLSNAQMSDTQLIGADLRGANLEGAQLNGADLSHARVTQAQIEKALGDLSTVLPKSLSRPAKWK